MFAARYAFRVLIDTPRPNLRSLVCYSSPAPLTDGGLLYIIINFHLFFFLFFLQRRRQRRWKHNGRIPLGTERGELISRLVFIFPVAGLPSPRIVSAVNEEGKGVGVEEDEEEEGEWVVRKRDRKGLKASL